MNIVTRAQWGARSPKKTPTYVSPFKRVYFVVHYSGGPATQSIRVIQDWCMDGRGFSDIDYNHLVRGTTGEIYEGRGFDVVGSHTVDYNTTGVGVCVISDGPISDAAKTAVRWLYGQYNARCGKTLKLRGHRQLATTGTDCPGAEIFAWVQAGLPAPTGEDDMISPEDRTAIARELLGTSLGANGPTVGVALQSSFALLQALAVMAKAEAAEVPPSVAQIVDGVQAAFDTTDPEQTAALLRAALGTQAAAVGRLLAGA